MGAGTVGSLETYTEMETDTLKAFYNEFDNRIASWLDSLVQRGLLPPGTVDRRSIVDVDRSSFEEYQWVHLFCGLGGWPLALQTLRFPADIKVVTGSAPCQPFSSAGKQKGFEDERHLWPEMLRVIEEFQPTVCFGEQVAGEPGRAWLATVRSDLEAAGYAVGAADLCAAGAGAPHLRRRHYWGAVRVGDPNCTRLEGLYRHETRVSEPGWDPSGEGRSGSSASVLLPSYPLLRGNRAPELRLPSWDNPDWILDRANRWRPVEPGTQPLAHGIPGRVVQLHGYGNTIVPQLALTFIRSFLESIGGLT